jgi:hypothetical protein
LAGVAGPTVMGTVLSGSADMGVLFQSFGGAGRFG